MRLRLIGLALAAPMLITGCSAAAPDASGEPAAAPTKEAPTPTPTETPTAISLPVAGSGSARITTAQGYVADVQVSWTAGVRLDETSVVDGIPECAQTVANTTSQQGGVGASVYAYKVTGSVAYPVIDGFQWPVSGTGIRIATLYSPGFGATNGQTLCSPAGAIAGDELPILDAPAGGAFEYWVARVILKSPNNPQGDFGPSQMGISTTVSAENLFNSEIVALNAGGDCVPTCRWETALAIPVTG